MRHLLQFFHLLKKKMFRICKLLMRKMLRLLHEQMDRFVLEAADLGKVYKIRIRHDNSLFNPAWYLDRVEVTDPRDNQKYIFHCERWLAKNKEDGKIEKSLYVKVSEKGHPASVLLEVVAVSRSVRKVSLHQCR